MTVGSKISSVGIAERISEIARAGDLCRALELSLDALHATESCEEAVFHAASDAWVAAADAAGTLETLDLSKADQLQRILILQPGCDASPPVFAHRIAAQHSAGVAGHLGRAAKYLEPTLSSMLAEEEPASNVILAALLLRSGLPAALQGRISDLHKAEFARFNEGQLRIPYSVIFDRGNFSRNIADLDALVRSRSVSLVDGSVPLTHLLLLLWLVPAAFSALEPEWHQLAIDARRRGTMTSDEDAAARSLSIRFGGGSTAQEIALADAFASARMEVEAACAGGGIEALRRIEGRPWQLANAARNMVAASVPFFSLRRRRPRIALCVSGQLRGYRSTWPTWRALLAGAEVTTFVHTWKRIGRGTPEPFRFVLPFEGENFHREYRAIGTELGLEELRRRYPNLYVDLATSGEISKEELSAFYGTPHVRVEDEDAPQFTNFTNPEKMYWKTERCFDLMEQSGETFDAVIRIRPDKPIAAVAFAWPDMIKALQSSPLLFCETPYGVHYGSLLMGDQFALGLPQASRIYARTYSSMQVPMELNLYKLEPILSGHASFAQACWLSGLDVRKVPIKFRPFAEIEPMRASAIGQALARDTLGRMDDIDRRFIAANEADTA